MLAVNKWGFPEVAENKLRKRSGPDKQISVTVMGEHEHQQRKKNTEEEQRLKKAETTIRQWAKSDEAAKSTEKNSSENKTGL